METDCRLAHEIVPKLSHLIFAVTKPRDPKLQNASATLTLHGRANSVDFWSLETLIELAKEHQVPPIDEGNEQDLRDLLSSLERLSEPHRTRIGLPTAPRAGTQQLSDPGTSDALSPVRALWQLGKAELALAKLHALRRNVDPREWHTTHLRILISLGRHEEVVREYSAESNASLNDALSEVSVAASWFGEEGSGSEQGARLLKRAVDSLSTLPADSRSKALATWIRIENLRDGADLSAVDAVLTEEDKVDAGIASALSIRYLADDPETAQRIHDAIDPSKLIRPVHLSQGVEIGFQCIVHPNAANREATERAAAFSTLVRRALDAAEECAGTPYTGLRARMLIIAAYCMASGGDRSGAKRALLEALHVNPNGQISVRQIVGVADHFEITGIDQAIVDAADTLPIPRVVLAVALAQAGHLQRARELCDEGCRDRNSPDWTDWLSAGVQIYSGEAFPAWMVTEVEAARPPPTSLLAACIQVVAESPIHTLAAYIMRATEADDVIGSFSDDTLVRAVFTARQAERIAAPLSVLWLRLAATLATRVDTLLLQRDRQTVHAAIRGLLTFGSVQAARRLAYDHPSSTDDDRAQVLANVDGGAPWIDQVIKLILRGRGTLVAWVHAVEFATHPAQLRLLARHVRRDPSVVPRAKTPEERVARQLVYLRLNCYDTTDLTHVAESGSTDSDAFRMVALHLMHPVHSRRTEMAGTATYVRLVRASQSLAIWITQHDGPAIEDCIRVCPESHNWILPIIGKRAGDSVSFANGPYAGTWRIDSVDGEYVALMHAMLARTRSVSPEKSGIYTIDTSTIPEFLTRTGTRTPVQTIRSSMLDMDAFARLPRDIDPTVLRTTDSGSSEELEIEVRSLTHIAKTGAQVVVDAWTIIQLVANKIDHIFSAAGFRLAITPQSRAMLMRWRMQERSVLQRDIRVARSSREALDEEASRANRSNHRNFWRSIFLFVSRCEEIDGAWDETFAEVAWSLGDEFDIGTKSSLLAALNNDRALMSVELAHRSICRSAGGTAIGITAAILFLGRKGALSALERGRIHASLFHVGWRFVRITGDEIAAWVDADHADRQTIVRALLGCLEHAEYHSACVVVAQALAGIRHRNGRLDGVSVDRALMRGLDFIPVGERRAFMAPSIAAWAKRAWNSWRLAVR